MATTFTNNRTGETFIYNGFVPLSKLTNSCQVGAHETCMSDPQILIDMIADVEFVKKHCCYCNCHSKKENK